MHDVPDLSPAFGCRPAQKSWVLCGPKNGYKPVVVELNQVRSAPPQYNRVARTQTNTYGGLKRFWPSLHRPQNSSRPVEAADKIAQFATATKNLDASRVGP